MDQTNSATRPRLPIGASLLLALSLLYFMCFFAFAEVLLCRYIAVGVFALLILLVVRSKVVTVLCILPCLLAFMGAEGSAFMPLVISTVAIIGFGGFAIHTVRLPIVITIPVLSCLLAWLATGSTTQALLTLLFIPAAVASALAMRYKLTRTGAVAAVSVVLCIITVLLLYFSLVPSGTHLTREWIAQTISQFRDTVTEEFFKVTPPENMINVTEEFIHLVINSALRLLPAILIVAVELIAYLGCLITVTLRATLFPNDPLPGKCLGFRMSAVSAILFLLSFVLSLLPIGDSDSVGIALVTALNLFVILQPGLAACGVLSLLASFRRRGGCFPILVLVLAFWFISLIPTILAFIGAFAVLRTEKWAAQDRS